MFRPRLVAVLMLLLCLTAFAAPAAAEYGFMIGANRSTITGDTSLIFQGPDFADFEDMVGAFDESSLGLTAGFFTVLNVNHDVNFRLEAVYNEVGGRGKYSGTVFLDGQGDTDLTGDVTLKTTYIELPVLVLFPLPSLPQHRWRGMLGMAACFAAASQLRLDTWIDGYPYSDPLPYRERVEDFTYHGIVGFEYTAYLKETPFLFGLRYEMGLRRFGTDPVGQAEDYRHRSLALTVGIVF